MAPSATVAVLLLLLALAARTLAQALRTFSPGRLDALCDERGRPRRFGRILEGDESATLACEAVALASLVGGVVAACLAGGWLDVAPLQESPAVRVAAIAVVTLAGLVGFVALPWVIASALAERLLLAGWPLLAAAATLLRPLVWLTGGASLIFGRLLNLAPEDDDDHISRDIASVVDEGTRIGSIPSATAGMIEAVVELGERDVLDVMTPRTSIVFLPGTATLAEARQMFVEVGHSRIPVIGASQDDILGVALAKDFLDIEEEAARVSDRPELLRKPVYVPETTRVSSVLERLRQNRFHLALVLDEYGGVTGLVTLEDILEEIIGDIADETDPATEAPPWRQVDDHTLVVQGQTHLHELNEAFEGLELPEGEEYDSIAGLLLVRLDRVPEVAESLDVAGYELEVAEATPRQVLSVRVQSTRPLRRRDEPSEGETMVPVVALGNGHAG